MSSVRAGGGSRLLLLRPAPWQPQLDWLAGNRVVLQGQGLAVCTVGPGQGVSLRSWVPWASPVSQPWVCYPRAWCGKRDDEARAPLPHPGHCPGHCTPETFPKGILPPSWPLLLLFAQTVVVPDLCKNNVYLRAGKRHCVSLCSSVLKAIYTFQFLKVLFEPGFPVRSSCGPLVPDQVLG